MPDLHTQLHDYVESTIERIDAEDVAAAVQVVGGFDRRRSRRLRPVWVFVAAAIASLLLLGAVPLLLMTLNGTEPTALTTAPTTPPVDDAFLTVGDLPGEWEEESDAPVIYFPGGLCSQIPTDRAFPFIDEPDGTDRTVIRSLGQVGFAFQGPSTVWVNEALYADDPAVAAATFGKLSALLTDCASDTAGVTTTDSGTQAIDLLVLPSVTADHVAIRWTADDAESRLEHRVVIVHLDGKLLLIEKGEWLGTDEPVVVNDQDFEAIVHTAVVRATTGSGPLDSVIDTLPSQALLTVADLPGEWRQNPNGPGFLTLTTTGLCDSIDSGRESSTFPVRRGSGDPIGVDTVGKIGFVHSDQSMVSLGEALYTGDPLVVDEAFESVGRLLTDCAVESSSPVTSDDRTNNIELMDLPALESDHVAVRSTLVGLDPGTGEPQTRIETRLVLVDLDGLLILIEDFEWLPLPVDSPVVVSDNEFEAIVNSAVARAAGRSDG